MADTIKLTILAPDRKLLERMDVESVTLTGSEGQIQILPGHAAMIGTLETGPLRFRPVGKDETRGVISTGFFKVQGDELILNAETVELSHEIDVDRAKMAQRKAEGALLEPELDEHKFKKYQLKLQRSLIRQQIARREFG